MSGALTSTTAQLDDADTQRLVVNSLDRQGGGPDDNAAQAGHQVPSAFSIVPESGQGADLRASRVTTAPAVSTVTYGAQTDRGVRVTESAGVRRLTPTECERLMSWPDGWTAVDGEATPDSRRYAACGDGVVANVAEWIGRRIMAVDRAA